MRIIKLDLLMFEVRLNASLPDKRGLIDYYPVLASSDVSAERLAKEQARRDYEGILIYSCYTECLTRIRATSHQLIVDKNILEHQIR